MALIQRKTDHERAQAAAEKEERRRVAQLEKDRREFFATPAGQARLAFERGDQVFQYAIDVMHQRAIIVAMVGSATSKRTSDPVDVLNSVCHEGWELVNGSFVFIHQGEQSRDKFMSSGQNVAVRGTVVGYYLFKRCEGNRRDVLKPWELEAAEEYDITCTECGAEVDEDATACSNCGAVFDAE